MKLWSVTMLRLFWDMRPLAKFLCSNRWQLSNSTWLLLCEYVSDVYKAIWHCYISNYCLWLMPSMHTFQPHGVRKQENYKDAGLLPFQRRRLTWVLLLFVLYTKREKTWMISNTSVTVNAVSSHVTGFSRCYCFIAIAIWTVRSYTFAYTCFEWNDIIVPKCINSRIIAYHKTWASFHENNGHVREILVGKNK